MGRCVSSRPWRSACVAASMRDLSRWNGAEVETRQFSGTNDVLAHHVAFEIHDVLHPGTPEIRVRHRERHNLDVELLDAEPRDRQADPVDGDGTLVNHVRREMPRKAHRDPVEVGFGANLLEMA